MEEKQPERRKYFRVMLPLLVSYTIGEPPRQGEEYTKDISGGGMKIPLKEKIAVGTSLKVQLDLLKDQKALELEAKVIWVNAVPDDYDYPYEAGVEFINVSLEDRLMISNCLLYRAELLKQPYR